jgi:hypothetical protein
MFYLWLRAVRKDGEGVTSYGGLEACNLATVTMGPTKANKKKALQTVSHNDTQHIRVRFIFDQEFSLFLVNNTTKRCHFAHPFHGMEKVCTYREKYLKKTG